MIARSCPAGPNGRKSAVMVENERIILDPAILSGKPVIRGTRLSVEFVVGLLADGWTVADILANYPGLTQEDITACMAYARDMLSTERAMPDVARGCAFSLPEPTWPRARAVSPFPVIRGETARRWAGLPRQAVGS